MLEKLFITVSTLVSWNEGILCRFVFNCDVVLENLLITSLF